MFSSTIPIENNKFLFSDINTDQVAREQIEEAQVLIDLGEYDKSITHLNFIAKNYKGDDQEFKARLLGALARNYFLIGLNHEAILNWEKAISKVEEIGNNPYLIAVFRNNISIAYLKIGEKNKSLQSLVKSLDSYPLPQAYKNIAKLEIDINNNFELSKLYLDTALNCSENSNFYNFKRSGSDIYFKKLNRATIIEGYAYYYYKKGDYKTSIEKYEDVLQLSKDLKRVELTVRTLKMLGSVCKEHGDSSKSSYYLSEYLMANDSLRVKKDKCLNLSLQNLKVLEQEKYKNQKSNINQANIYINIVLLSVLLFLLYITYKIIKNVKKENKDLKKCLDVSLEELIALAKTNDPSLIVKFKHVNPTLYNKLTSLTVNLTDSEIGLCVMIWLKFTSKEISQFTFVQHKSIQIKKYRLRKKLSVPSGTDIYQWLVDL